MFNTSLFRSVVCLLLFVSTTRTPVFAQSCANYAVSRTTGISYSSIAGSSPDYFIWRNTSSNQNDDNRTFQVPIGFDFWYLGVRYTHFSGNLNGIIDFSSSTNDGNNQSEYGPGHGNQFSIGGVGAGTLLALAPLYDDLWTAGGGTTPIATSCFYKTTGTAPNRVLTVEWLNFDEFNSSTGSLNFQIKLYETTGVIEFEYGTMTLGSITPSYACGINNTWPTGTPTAAQLLTQQTANTTTFSNTAQNALGTLPASNTRLTFTPPTAPTAPTSLSFTAVTSSSITLNWTDNATTEVGYAIYYSEDGVNFDFATQTASNAVSQAVSGLQPATNYDFRVIAVNDGGLSSALTGSQVTGAASNITSITTGGWNTPGTWDCTCVPTSGDNVTIANGHIVTLDVNGSAFNLTVGGGSSGQLTIGNDATARSLTINGSITVNAGATLTTGATAATHTMTVKRDITNNGTINLAPSGTRVCNVTFNRNGNQTISGSGGTTAFNNIVLNLGATSGNTLEVTATNFSAPNGFLTLTRGIFKLSAPVTLTLATAATSIPTNTSVWINNSGATINTTGGTLTLIGSLRASAGTINIGSAANHDLSLQGGVVTIDGGNINVRGFFRKAGISSLMGLVMSSGNLTLGTSGSSSATGTFNMDEVGSTFTMTGGTITLQRTGSGNLAFLNTGGTLGTKTGGTLQLGNASTPASQTFNINSSQVIPNLTIGGGVALTCNPVTNNINIAGDLNITSGCTFNLATLTANRSTSGGTLTVAGTMTIGNNTGGTTGSNFPNNFTSFVMTGGTVNYNRAAGGQTIYDAPAYNNLTLANTSGTQTAGGNLTVNGTLVTTAGGTLNMSTFTLGGTMSGVTNSGTITTQNTSATPIPSGKTFAGTVNFNAATGGQTIPGNTYTTLTCGNTSGQQTASGNLTVTTLNHNTNANDTLNLASFTLAVTTVNNTGTIRTQNTSSTPVSTGRTWGTNFIYDNPTGGQTVMAGTYTTLRFGNTSGQQTASGALAITTLNHNASVLDTLNMGTFAMTVTTVNNTGTIRTQNASATPVSTGRTWGGTVAYDLTTGGQTIIAGTYNNLLMGNTSGTQTGGAITVNGVLTTTAGGTLNMGTNQLLGTLTSVSNNGTIRTQNTANPPIPTGKTWGGTVLFDGAGQTISAGTYNNLTLAGSGAKTMAAGTTTINGDFTMSGTASTSFVVNVSIAGDMNIGTGTSCTLSTFTANRTTLGGTLTVAGTLLLGNNTGGQTGSNFPTNYSTITLTGGTVSYNRTAGGQTVYNVPTYNNLTLANTSGSQTAGGDLTVNGTLITTSGGTLNMQTNVLGGTLTTITNGGTIQTQNTSATPLPSGRTWTGTVSYNATSGGQTIVSGTHVNLTCGNTSGTQIASGNLTVTGTLTTTAGGTLNMQTNTIAGNITTITNGGTIRTQNTSATPISPGETWNGTITFDATTGGQTIPANNYTNLNLGNTSGTQTAGGNIGITGTFNNNSGCIFDMGIYAISGNPTTITNGGVILTQSTSGTPLPSGESWGTGTVRFNATTGGQFIPAGTYATLDLANTSGTQTSNGTLTVNTELIIASGSTLNLASTTLNGTLTTISNSGIIRTQSNAATIPAGKTWTGTVNYDRTNTQTLATGTYTNLTLSGTSAKTTTGVTVNGILSMEGTATATVAPTYGAAATLQYNTATARNIGVEFVATFNGSGGIIIANTGAITLNASRTVNAPVVVNSSATFILGTNILSGTGSFDLNGGANLQIGSLGGITSSGATGNIQLTGSRTYSTTANYTYNGGNTQVFGNGLPSTVNDLTINNGNTAMALNGNQIVNGALVLSSGELAIGSNTLTINGTLTNDATNCLVANGSSSLSIGGSGALGSNLFFDQTTPGTTNRLVNLTYNRTGATITLGSALQVTGTITPTAGTLATGGVLTLVSNAVTTGRIDQGSGSYITGNVTAERFIPSVGRRWRFMSSPVVGSTIDDWQDEIFITGTGGAANGFDATLSNNVGLYWYDETITTGDYNAGWTEPANTAVSLQTGRGYRVFIRGDRADPGRLDGTNTTQNAVTMNAIGNVNTGNITMPVTFTSSGNAANDGWNLLGNPYPSQIDWNLIHDAGRSGSNPDFSGTDYAHLDPTVSIYAPNTNNYTSYNANLNSGTGALSTGIIPSGAAFYVKATAASPSLTIKEYHKSSSAPAGVFKTQQDYFRIFLLKDSTNKDEMILAFKDEAQPGFDGFDIRKLYGGEVNIAAKISDSQFLTADVKPFNGKSDTTILSVGIANSGSYTFEFNDPALLVSGAKVWLVDQYTRTVQLITANSSYSFTVDVNNASTKGNNRFMIVVGEVSTGFDQVSTQQAISYEVFPTVTTGELNLITRDNQPIVNLTITEITGRIVEELANVPVVSNQAKLDMSKLKAGAYLLSIKDDSGIQHTFRFIKQ